MTTPNFNDNNLNTIQKDVKVYKESETISDLLENSFDEGKDHGSEDNVSEQGFLKLEDIGELKQTQRSPVVDTSDSLASFSMTFSKSSIFNIMEVNSLANLIKAKPENLKFVRLSFRASKHLNDTDMANVGAAFNTKMGHVEYLSLDFYRTKRVTIFGIHKLVTALSGPMNSIKSIRIRVRKMRYLDQQNLRELITSLRTTLVNLEELTIVSGGNLFLLNMSNIKDKDRSIEGLGLGLKKYEVKNHILSLVSLVIDDAGKDMSRYIREKFAEKDLIEGLLASQRIIMFHKVIIFNKTSNNKVTVLAKRN